MHQGNLRATWIVVSGLLLSLSAGQSFADSLDDSAPAAAPAPAAQGATVIADDPAGADPKVLSDLDAFCKKWMGFLVVREVDNKKAIKWEAGQAGVVGKFVGYATEYECRLKAAKADPKAKAKPVPVATITYREYLYEQEGPSEAAAKETQPRISETTEVMEIFRYTSGKWVY